MADKSASETRAGALDAAYAEGARTAHARVEEILKCEAAKGREPLAAHLALNTNLPVEQAIAVLAETPKQAAHRRGAVEGRQSRAHVLYSTTEFDEVKRSGKIGSGDHVTLTTRH